MAFDPNKLGSIINQQQTGGFDPSKINDIQNLGETSEQQIEPSLLSKVSGIAKKAGGFIAKSEVELGKDIAAGATSFLPKSWTGQKSLEEANAIKEQTTNNIITQLHEVQAQGGDTSKWLKLLENQTGQQIPTMEDLYPALKKTDWQVVGDILGTTADLLSAGSYKKLLPSAEKISTALVKTGAEKTLETTLKQIGTKTAIRSGVGFASGEVYDISQNLQAGETGSDIFTKGSGKYISAAVPLAIGAFQATKAITEATAPRIINSLIKPLGKDFAYGKNPGKTISEMGIVGNNLEDFSKNVVSAREKVGQQLGDLTSGIEGKATVDLSSALSPIDTAIENAQKTPETNKALITRLEAIKSDLFNYIGLDNKNLTFAEGIDAKGVVGKLTKWTGNPSDDKLVNNALKQVYGTIDNEIMKKIGVASPDIANQISNLNEKYGGLITAESAINHRDAVAKRLAVISMPIKVGTVAGIITAVATGGAALPAILAGVSVGVLEKAMGSTAFKSRVAAWLGSEAPSVIEGVLQKNPEIRTILYRALPKIASQLGLEK